MWKHSGPPYQPSVSPRPSSFFFFNDTATTEIYTLSLHDALPISPLSPRIRTLASTEAARRMSSQTVSIARSEEHTSELQSQSNLVCRLLLEKKKKYTPVMNVVPLGTDSENKAIFLLKREYDNQPR